MISSLFRMDEMQEVLKNEIVVKTLDQEIEEMVENSVELKAQFEKEDEESKRIARMIKE